MKWAVVLLCLVVAVTTEAGSSEESRDPSDPKEEIRLLAEAAGYTRQDVEDLIKSPPSDPNDVQEAILELVAAIIEQEVDVYEKKSTPPPNSGSNEVDASGDKDEKQVGRKSGDKKGKKGKQSGQSDNQTGKAGGTSNLQPAEMAESQRKTRGMKKNSGGGKGKKASGNDGTSGDGDDKQGDEQGAQNNAGNSEGGDKQGAQNNAGSREEGDKQGSQNNAGSGEEGDKQGAQNNAGSSEKGDKHEDSTPVPQPDKRAQLGTLLRLLSGKDAKGTDQQHSAGAPGADEDDRTSRKRIFDDELDLEGLRGRDTKDLKMAERLVHNLEVVLKKLG